METVYIPAADTIPVAWGWFQALLLLTFPLHLLAMNAMLGFLAVGVAQHFTGSSVGKRLAHRLAVILPLIIAFVVNLGVAPLLFLQVLYGQFIYTSSILMGQYWIMIIPVLIIAYYGAYLYDFRFSSLGTVGAWLGLAVLLMFMAIGYLFVNNMLLMSLPERFADYFTYRDGSILASNENVFLPRYLHMMTGAFAVGGLSVAVFCRFLAGKDPELSKRGMKVGLTVFKVLTLLNIGFGIWYLLSQKRETMLLFMGVNQTATLGFVVALLTILVVLYGAFRNRIGLTVSGVVFLVYLMSFMRAWLRTDYLRSFFSLDQLKVLADYSPLYFFLITLLGGVLCLVWLLRCTRASWSGGS